MKQRIHYIDVTKGIAILLVVLGHCAATALGDHSRLFYTIYAFHMPLWFFISGTLYQHKSVNSYIGGKVKALLLPYLIFFILNVISYFTLSIIHNVQLYKYVKFGGLWFLLALFYTVISYYVIDNSFLRSYNRRKKSAILSIISIVFLVVGMRMGGEKAEPMHSMATTMVCFFFFHVGVMIKPYRDSFMSDDVKNRFVLLILGLLLILMLSYIAPMNPQSIDLNYGRYGNKLMFIFCAILGIIGIWLICLSVQKNNVLEYLGKNSLLILVLHIPLWHLFDRYAVALGLYNYPRILFSFIFSLAISLVLIIPINKYLPELKGQFEFKETDLNKKE